MSPHTLQVPLDRHVTIQKVPADLPTEEPLLIELEEKASIYGRVCVAKTSKPAAGAEEACVYGLMVSAIGLGNQVPLLTPDQMEALSTISPQGATAPVKKGRHSVGLAPRYCGELGKKANGQVLAPLTLDHFEVRSWAGLYHHALLGSWSKFSRYNKDASITVKRFIRYAASKVAKLNRRKDFSNSRRSIRPRMSNEECDKTVYWFSVNPTIGVRV